MARKVSSWRNRWIRPDPARPQYAGHEWPETLDKLREKSLSGRVVVFSVSNHEEDVVTALKRGADGYLLKDMEPEDLLKALQQAAAGEMVLSEALTPVLAASLRANRATSDRDISQLTRASATSSS